MDSLSSLDKTASPVRKCHPIVIPQFLLVASSILSLAASCYLLSKPAVADSPAMDHAATPGAASVVNITICLCTIAYRVLFQVAIRYSAHERDNQLVKILRPIARHEQGAMAGVLLAWVFNCIFMVVVGGVQQQDHNILAWVVVRLAAICLALLAACSMFLFLEERRWNRKHAIENREEKSARDLECPPAPQMPFLRSTSFLSAKPSLSTISSASRSSTSKSSSISKSSRSVSYTPFPPPNRMSHSSVSSFPHHPKLKRVSSAPSLPQIPSLPPIASPARLAPSSLSPIHPPPAVHQSQQRKPQQVRRRSSQAMSRTLNSRRSIPSLRKTTSPLSEEAATFPGAHMASVRRARSRSSRSSSSSGSSASTRRSRLRIMETVSEPEEDTLEQQDAIPAVPQLDVSKWTDAQAIHVRESKVAPSGKICKHHADAPAQRSPASKRTSVINQRISTIPKDRPLPPLPLVVVKKIHVSNAQHITPAPERASSRISKVASIVRSKSAATARSVTSARVKKPRRARLSAHLREEALGSPIEGCAPGRVHDRVVPSSRPEGLGLQLEDRDLFRLSVLESIKVVGR